MNGQVRPPLVLIPQAQSLTIVARVGVNHRYAIASDGTVYAALKPTTKGNGTLQNFNLVINDRLRRYTKSELIEKIQPFLKK